MNHNVYLLDAWTINPTLLAESSMSDHIGYQNFVRNENDRY